jgi:hypothetical protein
MHRVCLEYNIYLVVYSLMVVILLIVRLKLAIGHMPDSFLTTAPLHYCPISFL